MVASEASLSRKWQIFFSPKTCFSLCYILRLVYLLLFYEQQIYGCPPIMYHDHVGMYPKVSSKISSLTLVPQLLSPSSVRHFVSELSKYGCRHRAAVLRFDDVMTVS